ncbi:MULTISPECIES: Hpt domain-containing protein [unclassified Psychrobacter]|uniref:Hpt domain-containing protein n=1 Tax=unclassified Psychrobacter TaxID=196806 RepID=UPI0018F5B69F|nr:MULTISPECIES: Hpt domain-containing protein [unclassified Psychrobacter]
MSQTHDQTLTDIVIDYEQFDEMRDLLEDDFQELVSTYIIDSRHRIGLLATAVTENDNVNGFEIAHAIKGASANLGAVQMLELSSKLQEASRANTINQYESTVKQMMAAMDTLEADIQKYLGLS